MLSKSQQAEVDKYAPIYSEVANYRMGQNRKMYATQNLDSVKGCKSYLDVGCGRGEMLQYAKSLGFTNTQGVESCSILTGGDVIEAAAWDLPFDDNSFEVVSLFDVIEHILAGDDERVCRELNRVASKHIFLTANNKSSKSLGVELHVNRRPYEEWDGLFGEWFDGEVIWSRNPNAISQTWHIQL